MLLISSHIWECGDILIPPGAIIRINIAWIESILQLDKKLDRIQDKNPSTKIFLDYPSGRAKPPTKQYPLVDLKHLIEKHASIHYFGVSNVVDYNDLELYQECFNNMVNIVPKIECIQGINNIQRIIKQLKTHPKIVMLDHDDLYADMINSDVDPSLLYTKYINPFLKTCNDSGAFVLRTQGVIFSI